RAFPCLQAGEGGHKIMGFFDFVGDLFGGGDDSGTTVTQTAQNTTDITVTSQIANLIDITALAEAVKAMGSSVQGAITATGQQTQALIAGLQQAQIVTALADVQAKVQQNELLKSGLTIAKISLLAV